MVCDRALAVDRLTQRIDDAAEHLLADRHFENAAGGLDRVAFAQVFVIAEHHRADGIAFEVERQREGVARQLDHFAGHRVGEAVHADDAVGHRHDRAFVARFGGELDLLDTGFDQFADFGRIEGRCHC